MSALTYREYAPVPALAPFVRVLWQLEAVDYGEPAARVEPILPDGCVEIVLHFGDPFLELSASGALKRQAAALLAGPSTRPVQLARGSESNVLGIRFAPGGIAALGLPELAELRDRIVPLDALGHPVLDRLRMNADQGSGRERIAHVEAALCEHIASRAGASGARAWRYARALRAGGSISALARSAGMSTRQLERVFAKDVGFAPTLLCAVERFQFVLRKLEHAPGSRFADLAQQAGYSDEPHFCREFRRFAGMTAGDYARSRSALTAAFVSTG